MLPRFGWAVAVLLAGVMLWHSHADVTPPLDHSVRDALALPFDVKFIKPDWQLELARRMPERVTALNTYENRESGSQEVYVGTAPTGAVYRFCPGLSQETLTTIAFGLGDLISFGTCEVSCLAVRDLDHDGQPELIAETSQILPSGRPRLYVWSLHPYPVLRSMVRPGILSSWGHGLGFTHPVESEPEHVISTYCGNGEVVEYQLCQESSADGAHSEAISWRQVGQFPASGEGVVTADADNDGRMDLCLATGFGPGKATIQIVPASGEISLEHPQYVIDEDGRFWNVRFLVGDVQGDGVQQIIAWWSSEVDNGECEIIRYHIGSSGQIERTPVAHGPAGSLWPIDGQMALADLDEDGVPEVWFANGSGNLWQFKPSTPSSLTRVCEIEQGIGPITPGTACLSRQPCLFVGSGQHVLQLSVFRSE